MLNKLRAAHVASQEYQQTTEGAFLHRFLAAVLLGALLAYLFLTSSGRETVVKPLVQASVALPVAGVALATFMTLMVIGLFSRGYKAILAAIAYAIGFYGFVEGGRYVLDDAIFGGWFYHWLVFSMVLIALLARHQGHKNPQRLFA